MTIKPPNQGDVLTAERFGKLDIPDGAVIIDLDSEGKSKVARRVDGQWEVEDKHGFHRNESLTALYTDFSLWAVVVWPGTSEGAVSRAEALLAKELAKLDKDETPESLARQLVSRLAEQGLITGTKA